MEMPIVRSYLPVRIVSLMACGLLIANLAIGQPNPTSSSPQTPTATMPTPASPQPSYQQPPTDQLGEIKRRLENEKLEAEIAKIKSDIANDVRVLEGQKLKVEMEKLSADTSKANIDSFFGWIAPLVSILSILILVATLRNQRKTALDVQERQAKSALELADRQASQARDVQERQAKSALALQERQGNQALQLKITELIMASRSPALARMRAALLSTLYEESSTNPFLSKVKEMTDEHQFPGDLGHEVRTKVFEELAAKYQNPADVKLLAEKIFSGVDWLKEDIAPPKTLLSPPPDPSPGSVV
jgi:hypothetical protein